MMDTLADKINAHLAKKGVKNAKEETPKKQEGEEASEEGPTSMAKRFAKAVAELVDEEEEYDDNSKEVQETFEESTYNKRLAKIQSQFGDQAVNSESVIDTIRKSQRTIRESNQFLSKLYNANAKEVGLWYKDDETEELYTTITPDYRKQLRKKYGKTLKQLKEVQSSIDQQTRKMRQVERELSTTTNLGEREEILKRKVQIQDRLSGLGRKMEKLTREAITTDTDLLQLAYDEHDRAVSLKRRLFTPQIFKQVWNEKIMNQYEIDKLQYLTSEEKTRYFEEKVRDLSKYDTYHILNHPDWFFRVVVVDFVTKEMQRLILWFKDCSYTDFDTIYRIVRKLNLLQMDIEAARNESAFVINRTNFFQISDEDVQDYTKLDGMLTGNTFYELFVSQLSTNFVVLSSGETQVSSEAAVPSQEVAEEQQQEEEQQRQRTVRQDIVARYWKSESNLTKSAYDLVNNPEKEVQFHLDDGEEYPVYTDRSGNRIEIRTIAQLKDVIVTLKILGSDQRTALESKLLQNLLTAFVGQIQFIKESLVLQKIQEMQERANGELDAESQNVNAKVVKD